jgi:hypothetical protein
MILRDGVNGSFWMMMEDRDVVKDYLGGRRTWQMKE